MYKEDRTFFYSFYSASALQSAVLAMIDSV